MCVFFVGFYNIVTSNIKLSFVLHLSTLGLVSGLFALAAQLGYALVNQWSSICLLIVIRLDVLFGSSWLFNYFDLVQARLRPWPHLLLNCLSEQG